MLKPHLLEMHGTDAAQVAVNISSCPRRTWRSSRRRRNTDGCPSDEGVRWVDDDFIGSRAGTAATATRARMQDLLLPHGR
jgi:hypothetical protein